MPHFQGTLEGIVASNSLVRAGATRLHELRSDATAKAMAAPGRATPTPGEPAAPEGRNR